MRAHSVVEVEGPAAVAQAALELFRALLQDRNVEDYWDSLLECREDYVQAVRSKLGTIP
ncbi:hypothetical protein ACWF94_04140 [Streptomyces sp. NPDC055078]